MRDIRGDLAERLELAERTKAKYSADYESERRSLEVAHRQRLAGIENEIIFLRNLYDIETKRVPGPEPVTKKPVVPIGDYIIEIIRKTGPRAMEALRDLAVGDGYFVGSDSPGRSIHAVLLNLQRGGRLVKEGDRFALVQGVEVSAQLHNEGGAVVLPGIIIQGRQ